MESFHTALFQVSCLLAAVTEKSFDAFVRYRLYKGLDLLDAVLNHLCLNILLQEISCAGSRTEERHEPADYSDAW